MEARGVPASPLRPRCRGRDPTRAMADAPSWRRPSAKRACACGRTDQGAARPSAGGRGQARCPVGGDRRGGADPRRRHPPRPRRWESAGSLSRTGARCRPHRRRLRRRAPARLGYDALPMPARHSFRTHTCGELRAAQVGERVTLAGWVHRRRDHGHLTFFDLRDRYGITRSSPTPTNSRTRTGPAPRRDRVGHPGRGHGPRTAGGDGQRQAADRRDRGRGGSAQRPEPVEGAAVLHQRGAAGPRRDVSTYRPLRRPPLQERLVLRSRLAGAVRATSRPSASSKSRRRHSSAPRRRGAGLRRPQPPPAGKVYALPQSPQVLKQLLMVAGFDRYYQLARAYRDEDFRADRGPEHTQIDVEMSYVVEEDVMATIEEMVTAVSREVVPDRPLAATPFRLTYDEALARYGSDKPDVRFGWSWSTSARRWPGRTFTSSPMPWPPAEPSAPWWLPAARATRGTEPMRSPSSRCAMGPAGWSTSPWSETARFAGLSPPPASRDPGAGPRDQRGGTRRPHPGRGRAPMPTPAQALGRVRLELGTQLRAPYPGRPVIRVGPPLPDVQVGRRGQPLGRDPQPVQRPGVGDGRRPRTGSASIHAQQYDLALNGWELGGGSIRIHRRDLLERAFALMGHTVEGMRDQFGALLDALEYGAPPHGGIAIGLDRWAALLTDQDNIREVMAFPKTQSGATSCSARHRPSRPSSSSCWPPPRRSRPSVVQGLVATVDVALRPTQGGVEDADQPRAAGLRAMCRRAGRGRRRSGPTRARDRWRCR